MLSRRTFLAAGAIVCGIVSAPAARAASLVEITMNSDPDGTTVWFDPVGVYVQPGQTVRWRIVSNVHTTTAYHPRNDRHSLRIPERAEPWDSGFLVNPGDHFDVTLTVEGVYDYFCRPHEEAGMVGRIVVGTPTGPGALSFDYFRGKPGTAGWQAVPPAAQKTFPSIATIMKERVVRARPMAPGA